MAGCVVQNREAAAALFIRRMLTLRRRRDDYGCCGLLHGKRHRNSLIHSGHQVRTGGRVESVSRVCEREESVGGVRCAVWFEVEGLNSFK